MPIFENRAKEDCYRVACLVMRIDESVILNALASTLIYMGAMMNSDVVVAGGQR